MRFENVSIQGLGYVDAPHRVTSAELEAELAPVMERFRVPQGLLEGLSGIVARRFWDVGVQPSEVATQAAEIALEDSGVPREDIGVLINTSVCRDYIEPSTASLVHGNLNLGINCMNFDIGNACLGFMNGMQIAANMIELGQIEHALIVNGEGSRYAVEQTVQRLLNPNCDPKMFRSQFATLTLGSGATAMVLSRGDLAPNGHPIKGAISLAATEHNRLCVGSPEEMVTDSKGLLNAGIELSIKMREQILRQWEKEPDAMDEIVIHQVSQPHTDKVIEATCLTDSKVHRLYPEFGNVGPAGVPLVLAKSVEAGRVQTGDHVGLFGIGSGINCMVMEVVW
jgi:acyl-CoA:acyl-CoA alkyltransferase